LAEDDSSCDDDCGSACGATAGNSTEEGSPISIGMVTTGVSGIVVVSSGSASIRSLGRPATFGARGCVRKVAQTVQFVGAFEGCVDEILPHFGLAIASARTPRPVAMALDSGAREPSGGLSASTRIKMARSTPPTGRMRRIGSIACE
jgi:hypothetical protein